MRCVKASTRTLAFRLAIAALVIVGFAATIAQAQQPSPAGPPQHPSDASPASSPPPLAARYSSAEIIDAGHHFFGGISKGIALIVEKAMGPTQRIHSRRRSGGAPLSAACDTATACSTPKRPTT